MGVVRTEVERWKMEKGNLIAYHLLESSPGAYIEWLVNELMRQLIKIEHKDARLVMLPANAINPQARKPCISLESFLSSCRVSLAEYN